MVDPDAFNFDFEAMKISYIVTTMSVLGVFAFVTAALIAWPALAFLGAKLFN